MYLCGFVCLLNLFYWFLIISLFRNEEDDSEMTKLFLFALFFVHLQQTHFSFCLKKNQIQYNFHATYLLIHIPHAPSTFILFSFHLHITIIYMHACMPFEWANIIQVSIICYCITLELTKAKSKIFPP